MNRRPLTIEFTGLPNSGKTTLIHNLAKDLRNNGLKVKICLLYTSDAADD